MKKQNQDFCFKMEEIGVCLYANEKDPIKRGHDNSQERKGFLEPGTREAGIGTQVRG